MRKISILFENKLSVFTFQFAGAFIFPVCRDQPGENIPSVVSPLSDSGRTGSQRSIFSMNRMLRGTETGAWKDYKTGYQDTWGLKCLLAVIQCLLIWMFWTNVEFFSVQIPFLPLTVLFFLLFAGVVLMTPNLYLLASRYQMRVQDYFRGAAILLVTKPVLTIGNLAVAAFILMLLEIRAGTVVLFMASIYGFLVVFMNRNVMQALDNSTK